MTGHYPVNLVLEGRKVLVVGGGRVATHKARRLAESGAAITVVAPEVTDELAAIAALVLRRPYEPGDIDGHWLVVSATGDPAVDGAVHADGEATRTWVNSADDPVHCSVTLPAVARRGDITVALSTGGKSPAMATWLRRRAEAELDEAHVTLLQLLSERREALRSEGTPTEGLAWQEVLDGGLLDLVRAGRIAEARERLQACL
ncbi:MAG TPA: bifunctional precorrin-2 dehydrogenase/sirohydrochlorin ferrochelatase [Acidimicrobiales bacterium]|nr:bifunctional precorrin-2 dehydrogenase/sirohydrochlorin ferrochelatase [Acidimicrobiales bacterium]